MSLRLAQRKGAEAQTAVWALVRARRLFVCNEDFRRQYLPARMLLSRDLTFRYPSGATLHLPDVEIAGGGEALVLGPSGSGKSTLLSLWSGLLSPKQGNITVADVRVDQLRGAGRDRWRGRHVGFVYQSPRLIASQSVVDNIELPRRLSAKPISRAATLAAMEELGVAHLAGRYPADCSLGERQRIGILQAVSHEPTLLLADEPTSALDRDNALGVASLLRERARLHKATLVIVTHDDRLRPLFDQTITLQSSPYAPNAADEHRP